MSPRPIALAALAVLACTSAEPPPEAPKPAPAPIEAVPAPVEPVPTPAPAPLPASTRPWVWYHAYPAVLADALSQVGTGPVAYDHRVGDPRRYTARRDGHDIELVLERLPERGAKGEPVPVWRSRVEATAAIGEPVVQTSMGEPAEVVVAWRIPDGYAHHAFADDGAPRSSAIVLDPPGFPSRGAALQLGGSSERPAVHVRGTGRAYIDELDLATGQPIARASFGPEVLHDRFAWPPKGARGRRFGHRWPAGGGGHYQVRRRGDAMELLATDSTGSERWRTVLDPKRAPWWSSAALLEHGEHVIVVVYDEISSGASVHGVDRERGMLRFSTSPGGIGNIGHSMYANDVGLSLGDDGLVRVHGHESAGDYLGVLDPKAGRLLGHEAWRR